MKHPSLSPSNTSIAGSPSCPNSLAGSSNYIRVCAETADFLVSFCATAAASSDKCRWKSTDHHWPQKKQQTGGRRNCFIKVSKSQPHNLAYDLNYIKYFWFPCWLTGQGPNTVIRGSELLMVRPRGRKLSSVVVGPRNSFLCGCMDPISQYGQRGPRAGGFYQSHLSDKEAFRL